MTNASSIKLPEFQPSSPATWLLLCESTFSVKKVVKPLEKYHHVVSALPASVAVLLRDVLTMGPTLVDDVEVDLRWETLKTRLTAMYALNEYEAFQRLINHPPLAASQKPSQLLSALMVLVPDGVTPCPWLFKSCFLSKLPQHLRAICRSKEFDSLMNIALAADEVRDIHGESSLPLSATLSNDSAQLSSPIQSAAAEDQGWQAVLAAVEPKRTSPFCYYHTRYGKDARNCTPPCRWSTSPAAAAKHQGNLKRAGRK